MRVYKVLTIILIILFSFTIVCSAKSAEDFVKDAEKENKAELKELQKLLDEDSEFLSSMMVSLNSDVDPKEMLKKLKSDNAYKSYLFNDNIILGYKETKDFGSMIEDDYYWIVPLSDEGIYISFRNENGKWQWSGSGNSLKYPVDDVDGPKEAVDFSTKGIVNRLKDEFKKKDIDDIRFVSDSIFFCDFIYISVENVEYVIPYSHRPDFTGLENGKLYKVQEALDILEANLGTGPSGYGGPYPGTVGGGFGKETDSAANTEVAEQASFTWLYFAIPGAIILIGLAVTAAVIIKKRHKAK